MPYVKLLDKDENVVAENDNFRLELTGSLSLPRIIEQNGLLYRFDHREGTVSVYKQSDF